MENQVFPISKGEAKKQGIENSSSKNRESLFPSRLRNLRKEAGKTQLDLCDALGVTKSTISLWEQGDTLPDAKMVMKLARLYGVSCDYLLCQTNEKTPQTTIQAIHKYTGLSEGVIELCHSDLGEERNYILTFLEMLIRYKDYSMLHYLNDLYGKVITSETYAFAVAAKKAGTCYPVELWQKIRSTSAEYIDDSLVELFDASKHEEVDVTQYYCAREFQGFINAVIAMGKEDNETRIKKALSSIEEGK